MSEERKRHISVLKNMLEWMEAASKVASKEERKEAVKYAIASLETDEAYQLEYENLELCEDCISRKEAIRVASGYCHPSNIAKELANLPSVTPIRPKGHWISHGEHCKNLGVIPSGLGAYEWCSECDCGIDSKNFSRVKHNFCPNCGADMREVEE